ncbi:beta-glucan synthesis-associated protein [Coprinopsis cinerea okayama7|uniref:Beta-glucan synthesis-associated protein n=1 Tax=Coprinopsis cinerea (strain Okayama-7 / 130 / ATCC MYA-4618 / FGSC 9003) TaxID=240176 RepID=A8N5G4_COPC7|nr:beta-glucan synthesis-associated protein [Coprinopsis cinerea okayama7\|eukprot:XP_001830109.2 beta-glucan synthesis-associated protein [Coprinopsis cinerea okayama7\
MSSWPPKLTRDSDLWSDFSDKTPYPSVARTSFNSMSLSGKYSLTIDPRDWETLESDLEEDEKTGTRGLRSLAYNPLSLRGLGNVASLSILLGGLIALFVGYPVISAINSREISTLGGFNLGGINASGQVPAMGGHGLIDSDTPRSAYVLRSWDNPSQEMQLVFSDEFNTDNRSFYPGDDPYWEAVDLHYWATGNLEWYDPAAVTTQDGSLVITLDQKHTHGMDYQGGLISSWQVATPPPSPCSNINYRNKFCFTGGYIETSVMLPGANNILGLWPAIWTMGNLGRAGYGASLEGVIDRNTLVAGVSQSAQWAPFDDQYTWDSSPENMIIPDPSISTLNTFVGGATQQATSVITRTNPNCYEDNGGCYSVYGFEYKPGFDDAYITWISDGAVAWTLKAGGVGPDPTVQISGRPVSQEPMYIIMNLGMSRSFGPVDIAHLPFPVQMKIDYVRVYQPANAINIGCDPKDFPTKSYIDQYVFSSFLSGQGALGGWELTF